MDLGSATTSIFGGAQAGQYVTALTAVEIALINMRWGFSELFEKQAVKIIMPDVQKCGGLATAKKIANLAQMYYAPIAPHYRASLVGKRAACHAMATVPNFLVQEWHWGHPAERLARWKRYVQEGDIFRRATSPPCWTIRGSASH